MTTNTVTVQGNTRPLSLSYAPGGDGLAPALINAYGAMTVPAYYRAVSLLAENLARFPRSVAKDGAKLASDETPHPLTPLLKRAPNAYIGNAFIFWRSLFYSWQHQGNGLARIERDPRTLRPVALHLVQPHDVRAGLIARPPEKEGERPTAIEKWYLHRPTREVIPASDMIHLQNISHDGVEGINPVALHETTLQYAATLTRYSTRFLQKGTMIKGAISFPAEMTDDELDAVAAYIRRNFTGPDAEKDVLIVPAGGTPHNFTLTHQQSQIVEQGAQATKLIAQLTNVPPDLLFDRSESKYSGVTESGRYLVQYTFGPLITQVEAELTAKLLPIIDQDDGYTVQVNPNALLRGDTKTQMEVVTMGVNAGIYTENEGRDVLGLPRNDSPDADRLKRTGDTSPGVPAAASEE